MPETGTSRLDSMDSEWYFAVITPADRVYRDKMGRQNREERMATLDAGVQFDCACW